MPDECNESTAVPFNLEKYRETRSKLYREALLRNDDTISDLVICDLISVGLVLQRGVIERVIQAAVDVSEQRMRESLTKAGLL